MKTIKKLTRHYTKDGTFISHQDTMCLSKDVEKIESITNALLKELIESNNMLKLLVDEYVSPPNRRAIIYTQIGIAKKAIKKATE